jgi:tetratricopeptide (TPR) repeat protein
MAQAALANSRGFWNSTGVADDEYLHILEAALDAIGAEDSTTRARLLAVLALEMAWHDPERRRFGIGEEAVAMARRLGDADTLLWVWTARHLSGSVAYREPELLAEHNELLALADRVGDPYSLMLACSWGFMHALDMGDVQRADGLLARLSTTADELGSPMFRWMALTYQCCRTMVSGSGDEIEAAAIACYEAGEQASQVDAFIWFAPQMYQARLAQGRMAEILDLCRQQTIDNPGLPVWSAALGVALMRVGERDEAAAVLDEILGRGDDPFPHDRLWLLGNVFVGQLIAELGTAAQAMRQYEALLPYAGWTPCVGTLVCPAVDHELATLAVRAERPDVAERHFADVDAIHQRLNAPIWLARTRLAWGRFLLANEPDRATELLQSARELADRMGAADIRETADALLSA